MFFQNFVHVNLWHLATMLFLKSLHMKKKHPETESNPGPTKLHPNPGKSGCRTDPELWIKQSAIELFSI